MFITVRKMLLLGMMSLTAMACTQEKSEGYKIEGEINGIQNGMVYLKCFRDGKFQDVDSATVQNGKFSFAGTADEPLAYGVTTVKENKRPLTFFIGNENVQIKVDEMQKRLTMTGSAFNDLYVQNEDVVRREDYNIDSLINKYPDSPVSAYIFVRHFASRMGYEQIKGVRTLFDASLDASEYMKQIDHLIARLAKLQVGAVAPDFTLPDQEGNLITLSSLRGKYVLIDFWASWCPDCRKENPNIVAAYQKFKDKNFTILGVSLDRKKEPWLKAIEKDKLTWTHVCDFKDWNSDVAAMYAVKWIPMSFLLDPEGKIVASGLEGEALVNKLNEILK